MQEPWCSYFNDKQEWLYVLFLCECGEGQTKPLAGAPSDADLQQVVYRGQNMEHYSNVHRIQHLASGHPLVAKVEKHRPRMGLDPSESNSIGRAIAYHQSPWDLKLTLAASGATMYVGFTTNEVRAELATIWWMNGGGLQDVTECSKARAVFFDIAEALPPWVRQVVCAVVAWERLARFLLLNERTTAA